MRGVMCGLVMVVMLLALAVGPAGAQDSGASAETVHGEECVTYPETGPVDLQYCVRRNFSYVSRDGEPIVIHEHITYTFTIINGQPVDCVSAEQIVIANDAIRFEKGRFTCP
jgi:hypothetical protein